MSVPRNVTPLSSAARWTQAISSCRPAATTSAPRCSHQVVHAVEVDERDGRVPVLGLGRARQQVLPERHRDALRDVDRGDRDLDVVALERQGRRTAAQQDALALGLSERSSPAGPPPCPGSARISPAVAVDSISTVRLAAGPVTISSRCDSPTRKKWKEPLFTPTDIRRTTLPAVVSRRPTLRSVGPHPMGGGGGPGGMPGSREPEQEGVAPELQEAAVLPVGDGEQLREDGAEDLGDLLGTHLAVAGQALGHLREPGDVDEDHRPVERSERSVGLFGEPADQEPRSVRPQDLRALLKRLRHQRSLLGPACECTPMPPVRGHGGLRGSGPGRPRLPEGPPPA